MTDLGQTCLSTKAISSRSPTPSISSTIGTFTFTDVTDILGGHLVTSGKFFLRTFETVLEKEDAQHTLLSITDNEEHLLHHTVDR